MIVLGKKKLEKLKAKNLGNTKLGKAIDKLLLVFKENDWKSESDLKEARPDADRVHNDGFYFLDLNIHRTLVLFEWEEETEITIVWVGSHQEYEETFKNNKKTIQTWLKQREYIE
ncbi:MAG: hypothetical protein SchgKO_11020 [Schleiferiaceae bacterium]